MMASRKLRWTKRTSSLSARQTATPSIVCCCTSQSHQLRPHGYAFSSSCIICSRVDKPFNILSFFTANQWPTETAGIYKRIIRNINELDDYLKTIRRNRTAISIESFIVHANHLLWDNRHFLALINDGDTVESESRFALGPHAFGRIWEFLSSYKSYFCQPCYLTDFSLSERASELDKLESCAQTFKSRVAVLMGSLQHYRDSVDPPPFRDLPAAYRKCVNNLQVNKVCFL